MKLASFTASGRASYGVVVGDGVVDLGPRLGTRFPTLRTAIAGNALPEIARLAQTAKPDLMLSAVELLSPIPDPGKIWCAGRNYRGHIAEAAGKAPKNPSLFIRFPASFVGHGASMIRARISGDYDYEGELALVIGKPGRHIARERALEHIAGYTCANEACYRDYQFDHSLAAGKNFAASGALGPWMVTADEIPDPSQLMMHTRLNGTEVQHTKTDDLIFDIPFLIAYISAFMPFEAGDILLTGTPEGVGFVRKPPLWLKAGDDVEVEISSIGTLRNKIENEGTS
jgi:2-keto-4-pentenoate hydratase/2-oxohepta-3-ene-1,7-dioic acid hydratase in catechol pathway